MTPTELKSLAGDLYSYEFVQSAPGGLRLPTRTTLARLSDGTLWVHSPGPLTMEALADLDRLGPVRHVVAPSCLHHLHAGAFAARYPDAAFYAAPGLSNKRPDLTFSREFRPGDESPWRDDFDMVVLEGTPKTGEIAFVHKPSRSLIVTDLVFNIKAPAGFMTNVVLSLTGTRGRLAQSRLWHSFASDVQAFETSLSRVLALDFDRLVVGHGDVVETGAKQALSGALRFRPAA